MRNCRISVLAILVIFVVMVNTCILEAAIINVTGGTLGSFTGNPDYAWIVQASPQWLRIGNGNTTVDTRADVLLDMGSVKNVTEIIFKNNPNTTGEQIRYVEVYAADETALGFDPLDQSKYTVWLFGGYVSGYTYNANVQTTADILDVSKRYLRIGIRDHANGWTLNSSHWYAELGDIIVPEPATILTLSLGAIGFVFRRHKA